jgi:DNA-binding transcriptional ArsR family regulator
MQRVDVLSQTFSALADPTRRAILARLSRGEASVTQLAEPFRMSQPAISKHLKVLERAGLVTRGREAQWRPCRLEAAPMKRASEWLERYRELWEASFERLEECLREVEGEREKGAPRKEVRARLVKDRRTKSTEGCRFCGGSIVVGGVVQEKQA